MDLEWNALVHTVMTYISPFLPFLGKGAEKAAEKVGEQAGKKLWETVQPALEARPAALEAAADLAADAGDEQAREVVAYQLKKALQADPELLATVRALVENAGPRVTATVHGGGAVAQGAGAVAAGEGGTAIGGSVQGDVVIGKNLPDEG